MIGDWLCKSTFAKVFSANPLQQPFRQTFLPSKFLLYGIKIVSLQEQILLLLQLGDGDISRLTSSHLNSHLQSLLMHVQTFYLEVESFTKNGDKFGWVKYWRMTFNSPKFSPTRILRYMVCMYVCIWVNW